ncbi:efflux RND transporter periplasmic adaptor subunit [Fibrobacter sp. HC4]|uniref:efflux RND transporter periplasmic adaptor subunit n=1 Tax=Fibrobacter sp. HC4 TaxID=3239812 RepID=UPI0020184F66|nr:efflux RND transporter periplasmic adaptor subunit [Fibrobacter succinogenes]MCL4103507.1 hypothetical protein [Fibrobacter succinogenes]
MNNSNTNLDANKLLQAMQGALSSSNAKINQMTQVFDVTQNVLACDKFKTATLSLVSGLCDKYNAERVSLGWVKHDYVVLKALSHTDHFEKKMQVVRDLEGIMEEAYEQDAAIVYPAPEKNVLSIREHELYSTKYHTKYILTVPIHNGDEIIGIICCERNSQPFDDLNSEQIYLTSSLCAARLEELYNKSCWFGLRMVKKVRKLLSKLLGVEHTWAKLFGILAIALILFATLYPIPYRVSAPAILKTDKIIYTTAPFDGYIDTVFVKPGDVVYKGAPLLRLNQTELKLEEADLMAQEQDSRREIQKAQAAHQLAEMRIHQARLAQTQAKLKTVRYRLSMAVVAVTADSAVIIEGDLQKRIGAPVNQGTELFQMASIENIYVEINVPEQELRNVKLGTQGLLAIKSRPEYVYRFETQHISPTAEVKEQENTFAVRGEFVYQTPAWFRPGMTGIAKIFAGKRTLWWILSHQAIDYLRLKLWW